MDQQSEELKKFKQLLNDVKIGIMLTTSPDGKTHGRPMGHVEIEDDGSLWFFTNEYSEKVAEISRDNSVYMTYASPSKNEYIVFNAKAELSDDRAKMKELWSPAMKAWFKDGLDDPKLFLVKLRLTEAEYWEGPANKIVLLFGMIKSAITGKFTQGEHGTLAV